MRSVQPVHRKVSHPPSTDPPPQWLRTGLHLLVDGFRGTGVGIAPIADVDERGDRAAQVRQRVQLDGRLGRARRCPGEQARHRSIMLKSSVLIPCGSDQHRARRRPRRACDCGAGFDADGAWPRCSSHALNSARATLGWRSRTAPAALTPSSAKTFLARPIPTKPMDMLSASEWGAESSHFPSRHLVAAPHFAHGSGRASPGHSSGVTNPTDAKPAPSQKARTVNRLTALFLSVALGPLAHAQGVGEAGSARRAVEAFLQGLQRARIQLCSRLHD